MNDDRPYPYMTLNDDMKSYIQTYEVAYKKGDFLVLYTDGFEKQFSLTGFVSVFASIDLKELEEKLKLIDTYLSEKSAENWGDERTVAIIQL